MSAMQPRLRLGQSSWGLCKRMSMRILVAELRWLVMRWQSSCGRASPSHPRQVELIWFK